MFLVLGLGLKHFCSWPREGLSSEGLSLALAPDFFCVLGLGLEPCVLDSTSADCWVIVCYFIKKNAKIGPSITCRNSTSSARSGCFNVTFCSFKKVSKSFLNSWIFRKMASIFIQELKMLNDNFWRYEKRTSVKEWILWNTALQKQKLKSSKLAKWPEIGVNTADGILITLSSNESKVEQRSSTFHAQFLPNPTPVANAGFFDEGSFKVTSKINCSRSILWRMNNLVQCHKMELKSHSAKCK